VDSSTSARIVATLTKEPATEIGLDKRDASFEKAALGFLRMREFRNAINELPHAEKRHKRVSKARSTAQHVEIRDIHKLSG
jgi:hypothetical protein